MLGEVTLFKVGQNISFVCKAAKIRTLNTNVDHSESSNFKSNEKLPYAKFYSGRNVILTRFTFITYFLNVNFRNSLLTKH